MTSPVNDFLPFANDDQSMLVGPGEGLTIENSTSSIAIYGELTITRSKDAEQLAAIDDVIAALVKIRATLVSG